MHSYDRPPLWKSWRQAGILAAAGLYALDKHLPTLSSTHKDANYLYTSLIELGFSRAQPHTWLPPLRCDTNMVWVDTRGVGMGLDEFREAVETEGFLIIAAAAAAAGSHDGASGGKEKEDQGGVVRLVVHHQVGREAVKRFVEVVKNCLERRREKSR